MLAAAAQFDYIDNSLDAADDRDVDFNCNRQHGVDESYDRDDGQWSMSMTAMKINDAVKKVEEGSRQGNGLREVCDSLQTTINASQQSTEALKV